MNYFFFNNDSIRLIDTKKVFIINANFITNALKITDIFRPNNIDFQSVIKLESLTTTKKNYYNKSLDEFITNIKF
jgi:hypothetical protein